MSKNYQKELEKVFKALKLNPKTKGYEYVMEGVLLKVQQEDKFNRIGKVYEYLYEKSETSYSAVERAIRYLRRDIYKNNYELSVEIFGDDPLKMSNNKFICDLCAYLKSDKKRKEK